MKFIELSQIVDIFTQVAVAVFTIAFLWTMANVIRYFFAGNNYDKERGGKGMLRGCIIMYAVLAIWGIFMFVNDKII